jgi:NADH-quinone oxidoreductase subunit M
VSYKVGLYDFSLWLAGLTIGVSVAAIAYGLWARRDRPRTYFGLMLFLMGATVGVFCAQDLLLFYAFFEAMLIPLYVLIGVWGGAKARGATIKFVIYTMVGSLLMLVSIIAFGLTKGTFDLTRIGTSSSLPIFLGFAIAFGIKAPVWPFHGWLPDAYREAPAEVSALLSGVISKTAAYGFLFIAIPHFPGPVSDMRDTILALSAIGLVYGSLLAFRQPDFRGVVAYSSLAQMCLIMIGLFAVNDSGLNGGLLQMVNHGLISAALFLLAGCVEQRTHTGRFALLGGMARGRPILATMLIVVGVIALAVPGSSAFAGEFLVLNGIFSIGWGWAVVGAIAIVLAAMYMLRAISSALHESPGAAVHDRQRDLRPAEVGMILPLVVVLLFLSFWPAGITDHSFGGQPASAVSTQFEAQP